MSDDTRTALDESGDPQPAVVKPPPTRGQPAAPVRPNPSKTETNGTDDEPMGVLVRELDEVVRA